MNNFKKLCMCSLILCHSITPANNDNLPVIVSGLLAGGIVLGLSAIGYYSIQANLDRIEQEKQAKLDLNEKTNITITNAKKLIAAKLNYSQTFEPEHLQSNQAETVLESILAKYGKNQTRKDESIISIIKKDIHDLKMMKQDLSQPCFTQNIEITQSLSSVSFLLENAINLLSIVERHHKFFEVQQKLPFYANLPTRDAEITDWVYSKSNSKIHPLSNYVDKAEDYLEFTENADLSYCPKLAKKVLESRTAIKRSIICLHQTGKIKIEATEKENLRIKDAQIKAEQDKNNIAQSLAYFKEREVKAAEESVRVVQISNELSKKKIAEIQMQRASTDEQNRLAILHYPAIQRSNDLKAAQIRSEEDTRREIARKNDLEAKRNNEITNQNRLKNAEVEELKKRNRLLEESNQLERDRPERERIARAKETQLERERIAREQAALNARQNPEPSAPPAELDRNNIPVAVAAPYSGESLPQATARYDDRK